MKTLFLLLALAFLNSNAIAAECSKGSVKMPESETLTIESEEVTTVCLKEGKYIFVGIGADEKYSASGNIESKSDNGEIYVNPGLFVIKRVQ